MKKRPFNYHLTNKTEEDMEENTQIRKGTFKKMSMVETIRIDSQKNQFSNSIIAAWKHHIFIIQGLEINPPHRGVVS